MGFLSSIFKRGDAAPAAKPVADRADAVQQLRLRARRRLIGAAVLVGLGVIGFPLVFETQPRPIPVDLPIEIPHKEGASPLVIPAPVAAAASTVVASAMPPPAREMITETETEPKPAVEKPVDKPVERAAEKTADKAVEKAVDKPAPAPSKPVEKPAEKPVERHADKPADKAAEKAADKPAPNAQEAARVQALLEGKPTDKKASDAAAASGRFIVQVGAYADAKSAQEARMKVEHMGLKTYTQAVDTPDGHRIRVRVGPFATRDEALKVAAKVHGGGLSTAVLTL